MYCVKGKDLNKVILSLVLFAAGATGQVRDDTARLAERLKPFRAYQPVYEMQPADYVRVQDELTTWIDSRVKSGASAAQMNDELSGAGLLSDGAGSVDDFLDKSFAGFLGKIEPLTDGVSPNVLALSFGIYTGTVCGYDDTVVLYSRSSMTRIARINAQPTLVPNGLHLRTLRVTAAGPEGRIVGSAWVASNCTSNWNGESFRIDRIQGTTLVPIANQPMRAPFGAFAGDPVRITLEGNDVTVGYTTQEGKANLIPAVERYRIDGDHLTRLPGPPR